MTLLFRARFLFGTPLFALMLACPPTGAEPDGSGDGSGGVEATQISVEAVTLNTTRFLEIIELGGETEPIRSANISAQEPGRIAVFELEVGDPVTEGDRVLRIAMDVLEETVDRLELEIDTMDDDVERTERLIERGLGREEDLSALEDRSAILDATIDEVEEAIASATTRAPISGVVSATFMEEGEFAMQGGHVARIVDLSTVVVRVGLPERDISYVSEGMTVSVRIEATGELFEGIIEEIGLEANVRNRTFPLKIHIENSDWELRAGMRATVLFVRQELENVIVIPRDAVLQGVEGPEVFLVREGISTIQPIVEGPGYGRFVLAESGLSSGDVLVVRGHRTLVQGEELELVDVGECCDRQFGEYWNGGADEDGDSVSE